MTLKMNKKIKIAGILLFISPLIACESTNTVRPNTLSGLQLQQLQQREYEVKKEVVFASVVSVLQDTGYIIEAADLQTGLITAKSPSSSNLTYNPFLGFGRKNKSTRVSAFIESLNGIVTKVRLNFVSAEGKSQGYGLNSQVDTPIEDAAVYRNAFEKIESSIFIRQSTQ